MMNCALWLLMMMTGLEVSGPWRWSTAHSCQSCCGVLVVVVVVLYHLRYHECLNWLQLQSHFPLSRSAEELVSLSALSALSPAHFTLEEYPDHDETQSERPQPRSDHILISTINITGINHHLL